MPLSGLPAAGIAQTCPHPRSCQLMRPCAWESQIQKKFPRVARKKMTTIEVGKKPAHLNSSNEISVEGHVAVGHARRVEGEPGIPVAVEKNKAASAMRALCKQMDGLARGEFCRRGIARRSSRRVHANR